MKSITNRAIPVLQIAGALSVGVVVVPLLFSAQSVGLFAASAYWVFVYGAGLWGGILLWMKRERGVRISIGHQIFLLPIFSLPNNLHYQLNDILFINFLVQISERSTEVGLPFGFHFGGPIIMLGNAEVASYGMNLIPAAIIYVLARS